MLMVPVFINELPLFTIVPVFTLTVPLFITGIPKVLLPVPPTLLSVAVLCKRLVPLVLLNTLSTYALNIPLLLSVPLLRSIEPRGQLSVPSLVSVLFHEREVAVFTDTTPVL